MWLSCSAHLACRPPITRRCAAHGPFASAARCKSRHFIHGSLNAAGQLPVVVGASLHGAFELGQVAGGEGDDAEELMDFDTVAAIVTGAQQGAVSIIRISGPDALTITQQVFRRAGSTRAPSKLESHSVYYGNAVAADGTKIDEVLLLVMLGPRSYTAEDVVEIHTHGGGICAQRVLQRCVEAGARLARPGEFTLRAFLNGRLDLSQAESVAQLIDARTVAAADSALAGLAGGLGREVQEMRAECIDLLTEMDVRLDFDEDLPPLDVEALSMRIYSLSQRVQRTLSTARQGQLLRTGLQVALVGRPNVGKSSLLNALSGTERAIVTEIAGTTRDIVEAGITIGGIPITLLDTAGLRESSDKVERIGVERSLAAARQADIVLMVMDAGAGWTAGDEEIFRRVFISERGGSVGSWESAGSSADEDVAGGLGESQGAEGGREAGGYGGASAVGSRAPALLVVNKVDLAPGEQAQQAQQVQQQAAQQQAHLGSGNGATSAAAQEAAHPATAQGADGSQGGREVELVPPEVAAAFKEVVQTSAATGQGLAPLRDAVLRLAGAPQLAPGGVAWAVNERQAEALIRADESLARVARSVQDGLPLDFWTIDLRGAVMALGEVSGDDVTEEVLDNIFAKFCIGK